MFFAEQGLTSTSASHIANMAKEMVQGIESELKGVCFYDTFVALIGTEAKNLVSKGWRNDDLAAVGDKLETIAKANSLIAWLREGIKRKSAMLEEIGGADIYDWAKNNGIELPQEPNRRRLLDNDDIVAKMDIKERNRYFSLEAKAAVIGKYIHPDGKFSNARKSLAEKLNAPHMVSGEGRDTLLYDYVPSVDKDVVESTFFILQKKYREIQASINSIKHDIMVAMQNDRAEADAQYSRELAEYSIAYKEKVAAFNEWQRIETKRISELRIVIPDALKGIYEKVNEVGK